MKIGKIILQIEELKEYIELLTLEIDNNDCEINLAEIIGDLESIKKKVIKLNDKKETIHTNMLYQ